MAVYIEYETKTKLDFDDVDKIIIKAVKTVMNEKNIPENLDVNVLLTTKPKIHQINLENRNVDSATDVLSFPYFDYKIPGKFSHKINKNEENILGDIILCVSKAKEQAKKYGHSQKREVAFLIVHSMLHLIGYDHIEEKDAVIMQKAERLFMEKINIKR